MKLIAKKKNNLAPRALLLLDRCSAHDVNHALISDDGQIKTIFLPPNVTSMCQPMDKNIILPVNTLYRKKLLRKIIAKINPDLASEIKKLTILDAIELI